jgi:hypothetical protein
MPLEIDDSVRKLNLAAPKATQLVNHTNRLIEALERRNEWVLCVIGFFPDLPAILHPQVSTWHVFKKVKHHFMLRHVPRRNVWRLTVANPPQNHRPPPAAQVGVRATRVRQAQAGGGATAAKVRRPLRKTKKRVMQWVARILATGEMSSDLYKSVDNFLAAASALFAAAKRNIAAIQSLTPGLFTIAQPSEGTSKLRDGYPVQESHGHARYERRTFKIGHMTLELTVLERVRWEDWLFGRLIEQEELLLA